MECSSDFKVRLLLFAKARECVGESEVEYVWGGKTTVTGREVLEAIVKSFPNLLPLKDTVVLALNQDYIERDTHITLKPGDEIAVIPPISGALKMAESKKELEDHVLVTHDPISCDAAAQIVHSDSAGATSMFIGTTRDHFDGKKVVQLEYECYPAMAEKEMHKICSAVREKWTVKRIAILHRLGVVPVGEASVIIAISSEHRRESLEAVQFAIDALKASVPIWKKEVYASGEGEWKENQECAWKS